MNRRKNLLLLFVILTLVLSLSACGGKKDDFYGKWGYVHEPKTTIMNFKTNGKVVYKGATYHYTDDGQFLSLESTAKASKKKSSDSFNETDNTAFRLRYEKTKAGFLLYQTTTYTYQGEGAIEDTPEGIEGLWKNSANKWSFEFTSEGTFKEDGYFPGYYEITDKKASEDATSTVYVVKLVYNDQFEDTYIYCHINGNELTIEYPWLMVRG